MENQKLIEEDEIDFRNCIEVIKKRKIFILSLVLVSVIITAILSFSLTKYEVSMVMEPPVYGMMADANGGELKVQYLDSASNIAEIIKSGAFNTRIIKVLNLNDKGIISKIKVSQIPDTSFLKVYLDQRIKLVETGKEILNALFQQVTTHYQDTINSGKEEYVKTVENINNEIATLNNEIKQRESSYKILEEREKLLDEEAKATSENTMKLLSQRESLLRTPVFDGVSSLLFTTTIQQNIAYSNQLNNELSDLRTKGEEILTQRKNLQSDIDNKKIAIEKINLIKGRILNVRLIQEPEVSSLPVGPRKIILVVIASVCSFLLGIFLALFMEFWQKEIEKKV